jgi:hypothetical protein
LPGYWSDLVFDNRAFGSWSSIIIGGVFFGLIFELPLVMADYLSEGAVGLTATTLVFGGIAFLAYVVIGTLLGRPGQPSDP